jgi:hypothetical protein
VAAATTTGFGPSGKTRGGRVRGEDGRVEHQRKEEKTC